MAHLPHSVRRQSLYVTVSSEALALSVRPQLQELNRTVLLPILERVLDEFDVPDRHIRIEQLDVALGSFAPEDVQWLLPQRFERELRDRIRHLVHTIDAGTQATTRSTEAARIEAVEHFLLTGTLPFWASRLPFSLDESMRDLLATNPAAIVRLFRRRGSNDRLVRRAALRLGEETLRRLLHALAPDDAALIIVYMSEIRDYHAVDPLIQASDDHVAHMLWGVALTYVLRDPGTQFNRTSLLRSLLEGLARAEQWSYADILALFAVGLQQTSRRLPIGSTLLAAVGVLIDQERRVNPSFGGATRPSRGKPAVPDGTSAPPATAARGAAHRAALRAAPVDLGEDVDRPLSRYEYAEALRSYLRSGTLPWSLLLRRPPLTVAEAVTHLPELTIPMLQALALDLSPEEQVRGWHRVTRVTSGETLSRLLELVLDQRGRGGVAGLTTLDRRAVAQPDTPLSYARTIVALLHGDHGIPDADGWPVQAGTSLRFEEAPHDAAWIKSVLTSRASAAAVAPFEEFSSTTLLLALVRMDVLETVHWLTALRDRGVRASALVDEPPAPAALQAAAESLLREEDAAAFAVLLEALNALPEADRPLPAGELRVVLLRAILDHQQAGSRDDLVATILSRLFGRSPARHVLDVVAAAAQHLADAGRIAASALQGLTATLASMNPPAGASGTAAVPGDAAPSRATPDDETAAVLAWLHGPAAGREQAQPTALTGDAVRHSLHEVIDRSPDAVRHVIVDRLADPRARRHWVATLGEPELARVVGLLEPRDSRLLGAAELLFAAWAHSVPARVPSVTRRSAFWAFVLGFFASTSGVDWSVERLTTSFFTHVAQQGAAAELPQDESSVPERVLRSAIHLATHAGHASLRAALERDYQPPAARPPVRHAPTAGSAPAPPSVPARVSRPFQAPTLDYRGRLAFSMDDATHAGGEPIYVTNAGLVLTTPFLPRLFESLDMLESTDAGRSRIRETQISRAVHLLQWLVDGRTSAPEPLLCLNKILCGVPIETPVDAAMEPTARELETATALLRSMLANWTLLENTSITGLQETFLQREGRLERVEHGWRLQVQRRTLDVLLDHLPWNHSTVVHSLMPAPIFVSW